eukprot:scaffold2639_cov95-Isochrysis_galbana.AAC.12
MLVIWSVCMSLKRLEHMRTMPYTTRIKKLRREAWIHNGKLAALVGSSGTHSRHTDTNKNEMARLATSGLATPARRQWMSDQAAPRVEGHLGSAENRLSSARN